ncbi:unnamed protein product [Amoebophrya sp. A25]|nr:unnamed protein product [Amoebophrya sp. A25]|eukprot:GSA25T00019188001.1
MDNSVAHFPKGSWCRELEAFVADAAAIMAEAALHDTWPVSACNRIAGIFQMCAIPRCLYLYPKTETSRRSFFGTENKAGGRALFSYPAQVELQTQVVEVSSKRSTMVALLR